MAWTGMAAPRSRLGVIPVLLDISECDSRVASHPLPSKGSLAGRDEPWGRWERGEEDPCCQERRCAHHQSSPARSSCGSVSYASECPPCAGPACRLAESNPVASHLSWGAWHARAGTASACVLYPWEDPRDEPASKKRRPSHRNTPPGRVHIPACMESFMRAVRPCLGAREFERFSLALKLGSSNVLGPINGALLGSHGPVLPSRGG